MGAAATGHVAGTAAPAFDRLRAVAVNPFDALDPASSNFYDDAGAIGEALIEIEGREPHWSESAQCLVVAPLTLRTSANG
jgi:hypothetical protein